MQPPALAALALLLAACGATPNRPSAAPPAVPRPEPSAAGSPEAARDRALAAAGRAAGAAAGDARHSTVRELSPPELAALPGGSVLGTVAGRPIALDELVRLWVHREGVRVRDYLEELVLGRLVEAECERLGVTLDPALVEERTREALARLEQDVARTREGWTVDEFIERRLGLDPVRYRERIRAGRAVDLQAERCVRAWLLESEHAEVRVILVASRAAADEVERRLAQGADFAELASELSGDPSREIGGRIPPVVRSQAALSRLAFSTPIGAVGGPVNEQGNHLFLKVEGRPEPIAGDWSVLGPAVEASLAERSIEDPEFWQWKSAMRERYEVDLAPFAELVGEEVTGAGAPPSAGG